jgi:hypothetical protein
MNTIELEGRIAHLEQEKAELYIQTFWLRAQVAQLANAGAAIYGATKGTPGLDVMRAALWAELEQVKAAAPTPMNLIETRTTRYRGEDSQERAVMLWTDYESLLARIK